MAEPRWLNDAEQCTWRAFLEVIGRLELALSRELQSDAGLPHTYYMVLAMLSEAPKRTLRMSDLARITYSSQSRISHAVNRLEELGWVCRERRGEDRRVIHARLTDAGFATLAAAAPGHVEEVRRHVFDPLTPEQVRQLRDICDAMLTTLTC